MPENMQQIIDNVLTFWNTGNADLAKQLYTDDVQYTGPSQTDSGIGEITDYVSELHKSFPDFKLEIEETLAEGNRLVSRWTCSGTQNGEYQGIPPTGKHLQVKGVTIAHIKGGRIARENAYFDRLGILEQLGAAPSNIQPKAAAVTS